VTPLDVYLSWSLCAVLGRLGEADYLIQAFPSAIRHVASFLKERHPFEPKPLYRGVLLDPSKSRNDDGSGYPFVSWSEDRDVARWFAEPRSYISEPFRAIYPEARGYLLTMPNPLASRVLFHHSWRHAFGQPLEDFALMHPLMGEDARRQIAWSLDVQQEVIVTPIDGLQPEPYQATEAELARLDQRFSPPWREEVLHGS
jgi:hypothetical protein